MEHDRLTVVAIYGHNDGAGAIPSIVKSVQELPGSKAKLLSLAKPANLPNFIQWQRIFPLTYQQYSVFVMHSLYAFIETDFCLIVQDDGWVLNGKNFKPEYYDYDYIGAATHAAIVGNQLVLKGGWVDEPRRIMVQNGGFSLRSKKFLEAPNKLGMTHTPSENIYLWNEDVQLTGIKRDALQANGIRFASEAVSRSFAMEYAVPKLYDGFDFSQLVGHHGQSRKLVACDTIRVPIKKSDLHNYVGETDFLNFLESIGYAVNYVAEHHS